MAPTPFLQDLLSGRNPIAGAATWVRDRWQQSQGQVPGGPPRIGNVSAPPPGDPRLLPALGGGAALPPAAAAESLGSEGPGSALDAASVVATPGASRERPPEEKPFPIPKDQLEALTNRLWEIEWAQYAAELQANDLSKLPSEQQAASTRATALGNQWATISGQIATERARIQTDAEQRAQKPPRGTKLPAVRKTYTPPGGTPVSAWVPQMADGNGGSQDDPDGTPTLDTSLVGQAVSGGETGAQQRQVELQTAQLNLRVAQQKLDEATSPEARRKAQVEIQTAELALEQARAAAGRANVPGVLSVPETQEYILTRDPNTGALTRERNPAYRAPVGQIIQPGAGRLITTRDPVTGEIKTEPNPAYTPEAAEAEQLQLEALRRGTLPSNAVAALTQETARLQGRARQELDRLTELQRGGALSEADASRQFGTWWQTNVAPQMAGLQTAVDEAQRAEQIQFDALQRAEDQRVQTFNRQREQLGLEAGQTARTTWMGLAPQVRTPGFLQQLGQSVANMAARAGAPSAEAAAALPRGSTFTADTFNPANFRGAIPNLDEVARQATARALAGISPLAAATINRPMPRFPSPLDLPGMIAQVPYRGLLQAAPPGVQPLEGQGAIDLGTGQARSVYPGGGFLD